MNVWLCPIRMPSWKKIKQREVFGVSSSQKSKLADVRRGDYLVMYILHPVNGVVAIFEVASDPFEISDDLWGSALYPHRVRIKTIPAYMNSMKKAIPLLSFLGYQNDEKGFSVEPLMHGVALAKISERSFENLKKLFIN